MLLSCFLTNVVDWWVVNPAVAVKLTSTRADESFILLDIESINESVFHVFSCFLSDATAFSVVVSPLMTRIRAKVQKEKKESHNKILQKVYTNLLTNHDTNVAHFLH
jgi:hypothetical protein